MKMPNWINRLLNAIGRNTDRIDDKLLNAWDRLVEWARAHRHGFGAARASRSPTRRLRRRTKIIEHPLGVQIDLQTDPEISRQSGVSTGQPEQKKDKPAGSKITAWVVYVLVTLLSLAVTLIILGSSVSPRVVGAIFGGLILWMIVLAIHRSDRDYLDEWRERWTSSKSTGPTPPQGQPSHRVWVKRLVTVALIVLVALVIYNNIRGPRNLSDQITRTGIGTGDIDIISLEPISESTKTILDSGNPSLRVPIESGFQLDWWANIEKVEVSEGRRGTRKIGIFTLKPGADSVHVTHYIYPCSDEFPCSE